MFLLYGVHLPQKSVGMWLHVDLSVGIPRGCLRTWLWSPQPAERGGRETAVGRPGGTPGVFLLGGGLHRPPGYRPSPEVSLCLSSL